MLANFKTYLIIFGFCFQALYCTKKFPKEYFADLKELQRDKIEFARTNQFKSFIDRLEDELKLYDYINKLAREHLIYK